ncbi:hypothetical protein HELRODRAFT_168843 [Helobdella robusta]|uniref:Uncharacterized protein n=1 Tax=Helobdella robusta TaxID=6412 RepID=T1F112_HELRO|nr:hypothetical protein HELRODRAFT_168843 [Helobdella robusta]ESO08923.1 hypothetical protein HELRODRAFT_168843 [Helobdella robusta]
MASISDPNDLVYKSYLENVLNYRSNLLKTTNRHLVKLKSFLKSEAEIKNGEMQRIAFLERERLQNEKLMDDCRAALGEKDMKLEDYEESLMVCKSELTELARNHQTVVKELNILKNKLNFDAKLYKHCIEVSEQKLVDALNENGRLERELSKRNDLIETLSSDNAIMKNIYDNVKIENEKLASANSKLTLEKDGLLLELKSLNDSNLKIKISSELKKVQSSQLSELKDVQNSLAALQEEKKHLNMKISNYKKTINFLRDQRKTCLCTSNTKANVKATPNQSPKQADKELESKLENEAILLSSFKEKLRVQEMQNSELLFQLLNLENKVSTLESNLNEKETKLNEVTREKSLLLVELDLTFLLASNTFTNFQNVINDICNYTKIKFDDSIYKHIKDNSGSNMTLVNSIKDKLRRMDLLVTYLKQNFDKLQSEVAEKSHGPVKRKLNPSPTKSIEQYLIRTPPKMTSISANNLSSSQNFDICLTLVPSTSSINEEDISRTQPSSTTVQNNTANPRKNCRAKLFPANSKSVNRLIVIFWCSHLQ